MASQDELKRLAQTDQTSELQFPEFPKLSEHAPSLAKFDPKGVAAYEQAIQIFMKNLLFNSRGGQ